MIIFETKFGRILMLKKNASEILEIMDKKESFPGSMEFSEINEALIKLKNAFQESKIKSKNEKKEQVFLHHRIYPLIKLLEKNKNSKTYLIWH